MGGRGVKSASMNIALGRTGRNNAGGGGESSAGNDDRGDDGNNDDQPSDSLRLPMRVRFNTAVINGGSRGVDARTGKGLAGATPSGTSTESARLPTNGKNDDNDEVSTPSAPTSGGNSGDSGEPEATLENSPQSAQTEQQTPAANLPLPSPLPLPELSQEEEPSSLTSTLEPGPTLEDENDSGSHRAKANEDSKIGDRSNKASDAVASVLDNQSGTNPTVGNLSLLQPSSSISSTLSIAGAGTVTIPSSYDDPQAVHAYWPSLENEPMPNVTIIDSDEVEYVSEYLFDNYLDKHPQRNITEQDWAGLTGAPPGAYVVVEVAGSDPIISISVTHQWYGGVQQRVISKEYNGHTHDLILNAAYFRVDTSSPKGTGIKVFANMVKTAQKLGIKKLVTNAAGSSRQARDPNTERGQGWNGYYTWPRFGYNGDIPFYLRRYLPPSLESATDLLDLYSLPGGAEWWKENGEGLHLEFDLAEGSRSLRTLRNYLEIRGIEWGA